MPLMCSMNIKQQVKPLLTQITGRWPEMDRGGNKLDHMVPWVWLVSLPEGDQWPHRLPWWRQPHGVDSMGKRRENKASPPASRHPSQKDGGKNGLVQETPTHCFASFISGCVNSLVCYACAAVFVLLHLGWPQCSDVLTDCFKIPSR